MISFRYLLLCFSQIFLVVGLYGQAGEALFVPNKGQWEGDFQYKLALAEGAIFFKGDGYTALIQQSEPEHSAHPHQHTHRRPQNSLAYSAKWLGADETYTAVIGKRKSNFYYNYLLGSDSQNWYSKVPVFEAIQYQNIYPGVDIDYYGVEGQLKYDITIAPRADPKVIEMRFDGLNGLTLENERLVLTNAWGRVEEYIPACFQIVDNQKVNVKCAYQIKDGVVGFKLGRYDRNLPLIIDPILTFSSYIGSAGTSWGFTATYGADENFYGGGVAFDQQYPITLGVFQDTIGGKVDMTINKFSPDGGSLVYSTFIGGSEHDIPHSIIANKKDELFIIGNTGSTNYPMNGNAFQPNFNVGENFVLPYSGFTFPNGSNIVIAQLSADGTQLINSTYFGGNVTDGLNIYINKNYGDYARSEVILLDNGEVAISSSSLSTDLPLTRTGTVPNDSSQNAIVAVFSPDLSNLLWGHYVGGNGEEAGYSIRSDGANVFLGGATNSSDFVTHPSAAQDSLGGGYDGYLAKFDAITGQFLAATYMGTAAREQSFIIEVDRLGDVYAFGQCAQAFEITGGKYNVPNSRQFIRKYDPSLDSLIWATQIGSGFNKSDLIPTAFMVDRCLNIYLSGWNGGSNIPATNFSGANTVGLPVTSDAFQDTTDGSDFYFMVLSRNADSLVFGSYFGGTSEEHVDGGTSRFSPDGVIYQAACAGCRDTDGFPTTPNAYAPTKPGTQCNYGAVKFDFQITVRSVPDIDFTTNVDTICDDLIVTMTNNSLNANQFFWDFGNGQTSTLEEPSFTFDSLGVYTITLVAIDTLCDISDTNTIVIDHNQGVKPEARFDATYSGCDRNYAVSLMNNSKNSDTYLWDFGDGNISTQNSPSYNFSDSGTYTISLISFDSNCQTSDTTSLQISFRDSVEAPLIFIDYDECQDGLLEINLVDGRKRFLYDWYLNEIFADSGPNPRIQATDDGLQRLRLEVTDTLCNSEFTVEETYIIDQLSLPTFIPNIFTPNDDNINDAFKISGIACGNGTYFYIFNRWGQVVFETDQPFDVFWDGMVKGKEAPDGVYSYSLKNGDNEERGHLTLIH